MWPKTAARSHLPAHFAAASLPLPLRFGAHHAVLRWLQPNDAERLMEFFASHTEETVYQRYGYAGVHMTPEQAAKLVSVDQSRDAALGVFEDFSGRSRLIAVGRYCLAPAGTWAEAAFVVHEQRRGLGIGRTLLAALLAIARERKLERLLAEVRQDNTAMLHILHHAGAKFESIAGTSSIEATIALSAPAETPPSPPPKGKGHHGSWATEAAARAALGVEKVGISLQRLPLP
jgi:ribosomal protein S18 acetylase RimI-like enzyme